MNGSMQLEALFNTYYERLLYFAWQYLHDKETSRDMVQEAFMNYWRLHENAPSDEIQSRNFLYVSVKNSCLKYLRHEKVVKKHRDLLDAEPFEEQGTINKLIRAEVLGEIYKAISSLPESCQRISRLSYLEGMKNQEVADLLGISINTVKTQKQRALQLLRLRINPEAFLALLMMYAAMK